MEPLRNTNRANDVRMAVFQLMLFMVNICAVLAARIEEDYSKMVLPAILAVLSGALAVRRAGQAAK